MLKWLSEVSFLLVAGFIAYVLCVAVERKTIAQMVVVVALLMGLQVTIEDLTPVFQRWSDRLDSFQGSLDKVSSLGKGTWEMPMEGEITQYYNSTNHGIDIGAPIGTPVRASRKGVVKFVGSMRVYGLTVIIDHGGGLETLYGHLSQVLTKEGHAVLAGDKIGLCGNSGESTGPHLHFEIREKGATVDPMDYLKN